MLLCWLPIPLGSNRSWAWAILEVGVFGLASVWLVAWLLGRVQMTEPFRRARWLMALMAVWLVYQAIYLVPLPLDWVALISPEAARVHELTLAFSNDAMRPLALYLYAAQVSWLKSLAYVLVFMLTLLFVTSRDRVKQLAYVWVLWALVISVYGILLHLTDVTHNWFGTVIAHGPQASATYPNRNHFAGYLVMTLSIGVGLLIAGLRDRRATTWKQFLAHLLEWLFSTKMMLRLTLCILVIALVSTHSRMGNTAFFAALMIAGVIGLAMSRHATRGTVLLLTSLIAIDIFIVGSWFGVDKLADRIGNTAIVKQISPTGAPIGEESVEARLDPSSNGMNLIRDFPLIGVGPGAWYSAFPRYRGPELAAFFDYAHNDYIQFAAESGVIGLSLVGLIVLWSFIIALIAQYQRRDPLMRGIAFASIMSIIAMMIHSTVDFNLQIPANASLFMVILALAWIACFMDRHDRSPSPKSSDAPDPVVA